MNKNLSGDSLIRSPSTQLSVGFLSLFFLFFLLSLFASCELVLCARKASFSTQQNSLRLYCFCFHRNVISSLSARSICVFSHGRLGNTSAHFLSSTVHAVNWNPWEKKKKRLESLGSCQHRKSIGANVQTRAEAWRCSGHKTLPDFTFCSYKIQIIKD